MAEQKKYIERGNLSLKRDKNSGDPIIEMQFDNIGDARGAATFLIKSGISSSDKIYMNASPPTAQITSHEGFEKLSAIVEKNPEQYPKTRKILSKIQDGLENTIEATATPEEYLAKKWGETVLPKNNPLNKAPKGGSFSR